MPEHSRETPMTEADEQKMIHALSGIAQGVQAILTLLTEMQAYRVKTDEKMLEYMMITSRKH
jgi:hypothetical protein